MTEDTLFPNDATPAPQARPALPGTPRLQRAIRNQVEIMQTDLDSLLEDDHQARAVWSYVENANLSKLYAKIRAVEGNVGRNPIDPKILLALWLYATLDGVGSARALARLCEDHIAYRWICGGVSVNYHTLADFRSESAELLDELLTEGVTCLRAAGAVSLMRVAHDGMRVRANAGSGSFRRKPRLDDFYDEAERQVKALRDELDEDPAAGGVRVKAAKTRAAHERLERVKDALKQFPEVRARRKKDKDQARVSITDPDARKMHMADGGFRPAYNVQFTTDTQSQVIVDAAVSQSNSDGGLLLPAVKRTRERHACASREMLADAGFARNEDVIALAALPEACTVYMPVPKPKTRKGKAVGPRADEPPEVKKWRERMQTDEARKIYKERCATAECVNALARNRGMQQLPVRGLEKVRAVILLFAVAHNLKRMQTLMTKQ